MKCPHCKKEIDVKKRVKNMLNKIMSLVKNKPSSIAEISRELNLNRSTLRYYLYLLKQDNFIKYERKEKTAGRPTIIKLKYGK